MNIMCCYCVLYKCLGILLEKVGCDKSISKLLFTKISNLLCECAANFLNRYSVFKIQESSGMLCWKCYWLPFSRSLTIAEILCFCLQFYNYFCVCLMKYEGCIFFTLCQYLYCIVYIGTNC